MALQSTKSEGMLGGKCTDAHSIRTSLTSSILQNNARGHQKLLHTAKGVCIRILNYPEPKYEGYLGGPETVHLGEKASDQAARPTLDMLSHVILKSQASSSHSTEPLCPHHSEPSSTPATISSRSARGLSSSSGSSGSSSAVPSFSMVGCTTFSEA